MTEDGRRVVHVRGSNEIGLTLDALALRVEHPGRSPVWMPLQRISLLNVQGWQPGRLADRTGGP